MVSICSRMCRWNQLGGTNVCIQYRGIEYMRKFATLVLPWIERVPAIGAYAAVFRDTLFASDLQNEFIAFSSPGDRFLYI
eukprot:scaffold165974_cov35-Tisochrysis_lutea.AAC.1